MTQRTIDKIDKTILNNFYKLVHSESHVRLTAAASTYKILNGMKSRQDQFNENLNYCVDRLVAGLSSNRAYARQGYAILLLEILSKFKVSTEKLMSLAQQKLGHINKEATRDSLLAYFLLISIILQSGNHKAYPKSVEVLYKQLIQLIYTKSYFDYPVSKLLVQYRELFYQYMFDDIPQHAFEVDAKLTTTQLLIIILCHQTKPLRGLASIDANGFNHFASLLVHDKFQKHPLHPIFVEMSKVVVDNFSNQFESFYNTVILAQFFRANHNELASLGLEFTLNFISTCKPSDESINCLFNEHVIRLLILSLRNRTSLYNKSLEFFSSLSSLFRSITEKVTDSQSPGHFTQFLILQKLTSAPGSIAFDEDSKSKSVNTLLHEATPNVLKKYLEKLIIAFNKPQNNDRDLIQLSIARQIAFVVNRPQMAEEHATIVKSVKFLLISSLFTITQDDSAKKDHEMEQFWNAQGLPKPNRVIKDKVRSAMRTAYHSTMDHLISVCNTTLRNEQLTQLIEFSNTLVTSKSISLVSELKQDPDKVDVSELWCTYRGLLTKHRALIAKTNDSKLLHPITSLFLFYGLQVIEHELECKSQLEELTQSSEEALKDDPNNGSWADILTDQIIAILSATECNPWIRRLCESIFGSLLPHISQTSIDVLCEALLENDHGENDETDGEDDDDSQDGSSYSESSDDDGDAMDCKQGALDEEQGDENADEAEAEAIQQVDQQGDNDSDEGDSDEAIEMDVDESKEDGESDEEYLDDDQMMKLDSVIADMFRLNRIGKKDKGGAAFKLRCLDLVKKIVMKKSNDPDTINAILEAILPLAKHSRKSPESRPISEKITQLLKKMPGKNKYPKVVEFLSPVSAK